MRIYNSLTNKKEDFKSIKPDQVTMYNCGPTVYGYQSIGNYRSFLFADLLKRFLIYKGYNVHQIMNITDVGHLTSDGDTGEDKMEKKAKEEQKDPWQIASFYENSFMEDINKLGINKAEKYPKATEHIQEMINHIQKLLDKGYAYLAGKSVYFDLSKFPEYGKLSGNSLDDLIAGKRVEVKEEKKHPYDFALWIHNPNHLMQWNAPWGSGYPGWHLECTVMANKYLGETIDIHTGGEDNKFPHHECEIAQSEAASGKTFVNYWLHVKHLLVDGGKMSKSLGNIYTIEQIEKLGYSLPGLRYFLISGHYRQNLNFTFEGLKAAEKAVKKIQSFINNVKTLKGEDIDISEEINKFQQGFETSLDDDLNISGALSHIFTFMKAINNFISQSKIGINNREEIISIFTQIDSVLNIIDFDQSVSGTGIEVELIELLLSYRTQFKAEKNWAMADKIRDNLKSLGITIKDTPEGSVWQ